MIHYGATADHEISLVFEYRTNQVCNIMSVILIVSIGVNHNIRPLHQSIFHAPLKNSRQPMISAEFDYMVHPKRFRYIHRTVGGTIIDNHIFN